MKQSMKTFCLCTNLSTIFKVFIGARFFSNVIKSDDQNYEDSKNIETENSTNVDSFDANIILPVVHEYYSEKKQLPTLAPHSARVVRSMSHSDTTLRGRPSLEGHSTIYSGECLFL